MAHLSISLLGPIEITLDGEPVTGFDSAKVRALLATLAVEADRPRRRESLAGLLWPDWPERSARKNLSDALYNLRQVLGDREATPPFLLVDREAIQFNVASDYTLDVSDFVALVKEVSAEMDAAQADALEEAASLYRGPFLEGFSLPDSAPFEEWALLTGEELRRLALHAQGQLAAYWEQVGELDRALEAARRQVALEPGEEEGHRHLMRLLALSGRRGAALAQYEACRRVLSEELDVEPSAETTSLYEQIRDGELVQEKAAAAEAAAEEQPKRHNLPATLTPLIGRERELEEIGQRLADANCRLLTLVGPGGSGKTRLAVEAGAQALGRYPDGVYFVSLAPLQVVESIVPTVAGVLGLPLATGSGRPGEGGIAATPTQQLLDYLRGKRLLLVMDNYEHLLQGVGLVTEILQTTPQVKVLVTSRAVLNLPGEHRFPVTSLDLPEPPPAMVAERHVVAATESSAVRLYLSAAQRAWPDFELTPDNLPHVVRVCRLVAGMPLGILLAAAWARMLSPAEIATEIGAEIGQSLDFLETDAQGVPERQRSMRAVFDHSWRLLDKRQQEVLAALSVFRGSFTRQSARQVVGATLRDLVGLVDKSLLGHTPGRRYEMHELLRQYAAEKLAGTPDGGNAVRDRHAAHYAAALERWVTELSGPQQDAAADEMKTEFENALAAWHWAVERVQIEQLGRAALGLGWSCYLTGRQGVAAFRLAAEALEGALGELEAVGEGELVLRAAEEPAPSVGRELRAWGRVLTQLAVHQRDLGEPSGALLLKVLALLERAELAGQDTRSDRAFALVYLAGEVSDQGRYQEARGLYQESLALYRAVGDRYGLSHFALPNLGILVLRAGAYAEARERIEESVAIGRSLGDLIRVHRSQAWLGLVACRQGRFEEAEHLTEGNPSEYAVQVLASYGRFEEARQRLEKELQSPTSPVWAAALRVWLGAAKVHLGQYEEARASVGAVASEPELLTPEAGPVAHLLVLGQVNLAEGAYAEAEEQLEESVVAHRQAGWSDWANDALACLAYAARGLGRPDGARQHLREALRAAVEMGSVFPMIYGLPAFALLLVDDGQVERAVELYALASRYAFVGNSVWFEDVAGKHISAAAESLPPEAVAAAQERGRARDLWETARELLEELEGCA